MLPIEDMSIVCEMFHSLVVSVRCVHFHLFSVGERLASMEIPFPGASLINPQEGLLLLCHLRHQHLVPYCLLVLQLLYSLLHPCWSSEICLCIFCALFKEGVLYFMMCKAVVGFSVDKLLMDPWSSSMPLIFPFPQPGMPLVSALSSALST